MKRAAAATISTEEQNAEEAKAMPDGPLSSYEIHLRLSGLPTGGAEEVKTVIEAALASSVPDGQVTVQSVTEIQPAGENWTEERITPLFVLFCTLPAEFQRPGILVDLAERYHRELSCLWQTARDRRCVKAVIELRPWRQAGTQWICEFLSYDKGAPAGNEFNLHLQNTSQWQNKETGWIGHQGALVLDTHDGKISAHH